MIYEEKKTHNLIVILVVPLLLLVAFFLNSLKANNSLSLVETKENPFTKPLPNAYINQYLNAIDNDSSIVFSAAFYEINHQRKLVLINKEPTQRSIRNEIIVWLYPSNGERYKNSEKYKGNEYLDFTSKTESVVHHFNGANYGVREINLPFIDIEKLFIIQHGIWKSTLSVPFKKIEENNNLKSEDCSGGIYDPLLLSLLARYKINYLDPSDQSKASLEKYAKTKERGVLEIKNTRAFWKSINKKNIGFINYIDFLNFNDEKTDVILNNLKDENKRLSSIFDFEKLSYYYSLINLFGDNTHKKIAFLLNKNSNLLEPIYVHENKIGVLNTYVKNEFILDVDFLRFYAEKLSEISNLNIDTFINQSIKLKDKILCRNKVEPGDLFDANVLKHNQLVLKKAINPEVLIKAEFLSMNKKTIDMTIENLGIFPVVIKGLKHKKKKIVDYRGNNRLILNYTKDTLSFDLPGSFENLFVHKKSKTTGFVFEKNIFDLSVAYQIVGLNSSKSTEIIPYQPMLNYDRKNDLFRRKIKLTSNDFLKVDNSLKEIHIVKSFTLTEPLIFPKNYTVIAKPGITIDIEKGGKIISYSPIKFIGLKDKPIKIVSGDKNGQGLLILAEGKVSTLKHTVFDGLTNLSHGMWNTTSAITFYESPVNIDYVKIGNNTCEDALNIVRTNFVITNTYFFNTQSDAFDGDFVNGRINSCVFENLGNDAIDISGSKLDISNVKISNAGDKALSAGEDSQMTINKAVISNSAIALAGKDLSIVDVKNLTIYNTKLGFTAFQKKPEFGPSNITAKDVEMDSVETKYLIENTSSLVLDGLKIKTKQADVKSKMYGVEFGVSSEKTRRKKN